MCGATHRAIRLTGEKRRFLRVAERSDAHTSKPIAFAAPKRPRDGRAVLCRAGPRRAMPRRAAPKVNIIRIRCVRRAIRPGARRRVNLPGANETRVGVISAEFRIKRGRATPRPALSLLSHASVPLFSQKGRLGDWNNAANSFAAPRRRLSGCDPPSPISLFHLFPRPGNGHFVIIIWEPWIMVSLIFFLR